MSIKAEVILATSSDERFPSSNVVDGSHKTFWLTTGLYPQEMILSFKGIAANVNKIRLVGNGIRKLRIERCTETTTVKFEPLVDCDLNAKEGGFQEEHFQVNSATTGRAVRYIKIIIVSGYEQFACINEVSVEGTELEGS